MKRRTIGETASNPLLEPDWQPAIVRRTGWYARALHRLGCAYARRKPGLQVVETTYLVRGRIVPPARDMKITHYVTDEGIPYASVLACVTNDELGPLMEAAP